MYKAYASTLTEILYLKRLPRTKMSRNLWDRIREIIGEEVKKCLCQGLPRLLPSCAPCAYCNSHQHRSSERTKIQDVASRREFLKRSRLCFNCAKSGHAVSQCKSRGCRRCNCRHHTSVCERTFTTLPPKSNANTKPPSDSFYGTNDLIQTTLHSSVMAKVNGVQTRIKFDSGAGSSYISANLLTKLNIKPCRTESRVSEQMYRDGGQTS